MRPCEIERVLETVTVLMDTREQETERSRRRQKAMGAPIRRAVLDYGDYCMTAELPDGIPIYDESKRIQPTCAVERKMNLDELAECFTSGRDRFEREMKRAKERGASLWLLVENASWEALLNGRYRSRLLPKSLMGSVMAWAFRYGLHIAFCDELTTPILIREILYRDLKERLQNGEYG